MNRRISSEDIRKKVKDLGESCIGKTCEDGSDICKKCMTQCEMLNKYSDCPSTLFSEISKSGEVDENIPYSCNMCGKCTLVCPKSLDLRSVFLDMRKDIVKINDGKSPIKGHGGINMHQRLSFSKLFNTTKPSREEIYRGAGQDSIKRVFMPGCSLPSYSPELVEAITRYLSENVPNVSTVLKCCGKPTSLMGQEELFEKRYAELQGEFDKLDADEIIVSCQNCYKVVSEKSPNQKVISLWTILEEIGIPEEAVGKGRDSDVVFAIHDSCPTRNVSEIHSAIRSIMGQLGYEVEELDDSRENTRCCGMGGMVGAADFELAKRVMSKRASEAKSEHIVSYCASCRDAMEIGEKKSFHILDLIFGEKIDSKKEVPKKINGALGNWTNRYKSKKAIVKI